MSDEDNLKIDIVDDTPVEDRAHRNPLPKEVVEDLEKDDLTEYSAKVKNRIDTARKAYHDERRAKEAAAREREEAIHFAKRIHQENQELKQRLGAGERVFINEVNKSATTDLQVAKENLKRAYESADPAIITEAQEALTDAKIKIREVEKFKPSLQEIETPVQMNPQVQQPIRPEFTPDSKAEAWREKNDWFGPNKAMTALALGLHEELVESGIDPRSDEYYRRVDLTMRRRFPEHFEDTQDTEEVERTSRKASTVVAPATRSSAPRQIRITASQASIAKRLGITPEAYAREVMKLGSN